MMKIMAVTAARKEAYARALAAEEAQRRERYGDALALKVLDETPDVLVRFATDSSAGVPTGSSIAADAVRVRTRSATAAPSHGTSGPTRSASPPAGDTVPSHTVQSSCCRYLWYAAHDDCAWYDARSPLGHLLKAVLPSHCVDEMWVSPDLKRAQWIPPPPEALPAGWHNVIRLQVAWAAAEDSVVRRREIGLRADAVSRVGAGTGSLGPVLRSTRVSRSQFPTFEPWCRRARDTVCPSTHHTQ